MKDQIRQDEEEIERRANFKRKGNRLTADPYYHVTKSDFLKLKSFE